MTTFLTIYFFILGTILGSFYNVVGLRLPNGELFKEERSYCPKCHKTLTWYELIPILSFLFQKGRCRNCKQNISPLYPTMELLSGFTFTLSYYLLGWQLELLLAILLVSVFHMIIVSDIAYMIIPNRLLLFFFVLFLIYRIIDPLTPWWSSIIGGVGGIVLTAAIILASKGGMGGGDMKLFGLLGFVLGWQLLLVTYFLSTLIGAVVSGVLLATGVIQRKNPIPFGPFIVLGASFAFFSGRMIIDWYLQTFF
ncbi:prepilin peptidase [Halobacillus locisalis]|uniref:Prepilin peptidase n=1 Tax=Halobacillus locisalis TaxID=220753 RepID=A0A838CNA9_9BACI|nr:A24 family peptidase [Halobacillus locisalis]MBA2173444.1 prepilin peptidase [Halobacillus locisalis]